MTGRGGAIHPSAPELSALAARAARGAVLPWAIAEEAGRAAAWLACRGIDGAGALIARLDGPPGAAFVPAPGHWPSDGPVCALHAGIALADFAALPEGPGPQGLTLGPVRDPVLLLPFAARAAATRGTALDLGIGGVPRARIGAGGVAIIGPPLPGGVAGPVTLDPATGAPPTTTTTRPRPVPADLWARLEALALGSTVPSSARSQADAGATVGDND